MLLELFGRHLLWDFPDKEVVVNNLLWVGSQQVVVVRKSTTWLAWSKFEVAEGLACLLEFVFFRNGHDGGVEGSVNITSYLRNSAKDDASLVLEVGGELGACGDIFG